MNKDIAKRQAAKQKNNKSRSQKNNKSRSKTQFINGKRVTAVQTRRDGSKVYYGSNNVVLREVNSRGVTVVRIGVTPFGGGKAPSGKKISRLTAPIIQQQRAKEQLTNQLRQQVRNSKVFRGLPQSVDVSRLALRPIIRRVGQSNVIIGYEDPFFNQTVKKIVSAQELKIIQEKTIKRVQRERMPFQSPERRQSIDIDFFIKTLSSKKEKTIPLTGFIRNADSRILLARNRIISSNPSIITGSRLNLLFQGSAELITYTLLRQLGRGVQGISQLPATVALLYRNPLLIKKIPGLLRVEQKKYFRLWRTSPFEALVVTGAEILFMKGTGAAFKSLSKLRTAVFIRLNPKFKGVLRTGRNIVLNVGGGKTATLKVVSSIPKQTLKKQISLIGKRVNAISTQADKLLTIAKRKRVVRKPIPGEASFNEVTKSLLKKFDKGTIKRSELIKLEFLIKKQGAKGLLERSFFASPGGDIRPSRLGLLESSSPLIKRFYQILTNITFKKPHPQILFFKNVVIERFPKTLLFSRIKRKLRKGGALTQEEFIALLEWQNKGSGKFKPLGFISGEDEITLPPGAILKRKKVIGVTLFKGKRIPIVLVESYSPSSNIKVLLRKADSGVISGRERLSLKRLLKKETGFNYGSGAVSGKRFVSIKRLISSGVVSLSKSRKVVSRASRTLSKGSKSKPSKSSKVSSKRFSGRSVVSKKSVKSSSRASKASKASRSAKSIVLRRLSGGSSRVVTRLPPSIPSKVKDIFRRRKKVSEKDKKELLDYVKKSRAVYRPSLAAVIYNITAYKIPKSVNPFDIRPLIIQLKKRK